MAVTDTGDQVRDTDIAVVGMSGRFPGASDVATFWTNIASGTESIRRFSREELLASGVDPALADDPAYVPARPVLDDVRGFDAAFFRFSPRDATIADPQQRLFLECAWEALEVAGYPDPETRGRVGVYAGANLSTYMLERGAQFEQDLDAGSFEVVIGNDKDALSTMVSYKLNLTGPSVSVQTFCSTSLVGVHLACQALRAGECELALAGGVSVRVPDTVGHLYTPGGLESPDGHVRTFDAGVRGTMYGDGVAVVLLKPARAALADGDTVLALIRGSAVNNDGTMRFGFAAPSMVGQAAVVSAALANAGVRAGQIGYVEAHGAATELGDPIEVAALTQAFGDVARERRCVLGSVKPNVGHLDRASGVTGLIKVVMALREELIPPTLHFRTPNPKIDFEGGPFRVSAEPVPWPRSAGRPRIACVNSLGTGGTNAHVVVQEPPPVPERPPGPRRHHVLPVSARSEAALEQSCARLARHLDERAPRLADVAFTLQAGRRVFDHRRVLVAASTAQAASLLRGEPTGGTPARTRHESWRARPVTFLLAGEGEQFPGMVAGLYATEPVFRAHVDECLTLLDEPLAAGIGALLLTPPRPAGQETESRAPHGTEAEENPRPAPPRRTEVEEHPRAALPCRTEVEEHPRAALPCRTEVAQTAAFVAGYALARTLMHWGVTPSTMIGYSVGEYVAACLSGVLSLPDALRLVAYRARLIAARPAGAMLAVATGEARLRGLVPDLAARGVDLAADNGDQVVVAGAPEPIARLARELTERGVACRDLRTTHAFNSRMLAGVRDELTAWATVSVTPHPPTLPYLSNVTGALATADLVTDPGYWAAHMCATVRFADAVATALSDPDTGFVEIGPGRSLGTMVRSHPACEQDRRPLILPTQPAAGDDRPDDEVLAEALGRLWLAGAHVDWLTYHGRGGMAHGHGVADGPGVAGGLDAASGSGVAGRSGVADKPGVAGAGGSGVADKPGVAGADGRGVAIGPDMTDGHGGADGPGGAVQGHGGVALPGRVPLPTYPFERRPYWLEARRGAATGRAPASRKDEPEALPLLPEDQWLHLPVWRQTAPRRPAPVGGVWLVLTAPGAEPVADALTARLDALGASHLSVSPGARYAEADGGFTIRPGVPEDARTLLAALKAAGRIPIRVVHLWHLGTPGEAITEATAEDPAERAVRHGLHTLVGLAQAYGDLGLTWWCDVVTTGSQHVLPADAARMRPEQATAVGACRMLPVEYPGTAARLVDIGKPAGDVLTQLVDELLGEPADRVVALREGRRWTPSYDPAPRLAAPAAPALPDVPAVEGRRWTPSYDPAPCPAAPAVPAAPDVPAVSAVQGRRWTPSAIAAVPGTSAVPYGPGVSAVTAGAEMVPGPRRGGVYLITGGLGAVGMALARQLAGEYAANLILLGRTPLPPRERWAAVLCDEAAVPGLRRRLRDVFELERLGAEVTVVSGDVADQTVVRQAVDLAKERYGGLDGVLHAAGVPGAGLTRFTTTAGIDQVLAPKVAGTRALLRELRGEQVGFVVLFSSTDVATGGGTGRLASCAANAYLDASAYARPLPGTRVVSIGWGEWVQNTRAEDLSGYTPETRELSVRRRAAFGIGEEQGWRAMLDALRGGEPHLIVSTQDFTEIVSRSLLLAIEDPHETSQPAALVDATTTPAAAPEDAEPDADRQARVDRRKQSLRARRR
ncbi:type I polyketide synthase [Sphaerisporangium sp. B11E5]|uniref:type I polyketide synthase n=1 Tax=Sphaerisporangium sp. B11E5 TaxID=3153563 RepID=UPI00325F4C06